MPSSTTTAAASNSAASRIAAPLRETDFPVGRLALADGTIFIGRCFGAINLKTKSVGEVVFNTAMTGYQEALTDPSYTGQILTLTVAQVGNYGISPEDIESKKVQVAGFIIKDLSRIDSNFRSTINLHEYLKQAGVLGLFGIDTRALTRALRTGGVTQGVISDDPTITDQQLIDMARQAPSMAGQNLVPLVGCSSNQTWSETLGEWSLEVQLPTGAQRSKTYRVLALDCGAKSNILRNLADRGCEVKVVPHTITAAEILKLMEQGQADGLFISNGPGDPAAVEQTIQTLRGVLSAPNDKVPPTFGICLGHQLLALAIGAKTFKLPFGHRGANQPVKNLLTGKVEITSQNHGFAVDPSTLSTADKAGAATGEATHVHLNDGTLAGFRLTDRPVFCVQYHPEASPGPHDSSYLFDAFVKMMNDRKPATFA